MTTRRLLTSHSPVTTRDMSSAPICCRDGSKKPSLKTITKEIHARHALTLERSRPDDDGGDPPQQRCVKQQRERPDVGARETPQPLVSVHGQEKLKPGDEADGELRPQQIVRRHHFSWQRGS